MGGRRVAGCWDRCGVRCAARSGVSDIEGLELTKGGREGGYFWKECPGLGRGNLQLFLQTRFNCLLACRHEVANFPGGDGCVQLVEQESHVLRGDIERRDGGQAGWEGGQKKRQERQEQ